LGVGSLYLYARDRYDQLSAYIACCSLFALPFFAYSIRRWDVYAASLLIFGLFLRWKAWFVRLPILFLAAYWSPRTTDNILLLGALVAVYGMEQKRDLRQRLGIGLLMVIILMIIFLYSNIPIEYYLQELIHNTSSQGYWRQLIAYPEYFWDRGVGPWNRWLFVWLLIPIIWRAKYSDLRWGICVALLLSIIPKNNHYYAFVLWPYLVIYLCHGLHALPQIWKIIIGSYFLILNHAPYMLQNDIKIPFESSVAKRPWIYPMNTDLFQTHDGKLNIRPQFSLDEQAALSALQLPTSDCSWEVLVVGMNATEMQIWNQHACPLFRPKIRPDRIGYALIRKEKKYQKHKQSLANMNGTWRQITIREQQYWLFSRAPSWFERNVQHPENPF